MLLLHFNPSLHAAIFILPLARLFREFRGPLCSNQKAAVSFRDPFVVSFMYEELSKINTAQARASARKVGAVFNMANERKKGNFEKI